MPRTRASAAKAAGEAHDPAWSIPSLREPRYSQSLERGLAILGCFTPSAPCSGSPTSPTSSEMSRSTTHRYVITLVALGYLEQGASRKYRLGLRVTDLGMSALSSTGLREHARPYLEELRQRTSCSAGLSVLDGERGACSWTACAATAAARAAVRSRPAARFAPPRALQRGGQAAACAPAGGRAAPSARGDDAEAHPARHTITTQEGAARRA